MLTDAARFAKALAMRRDLERASTGRALKAPGLCGTRRFNELATSTFEYVVEVAKGCRGLRSALGSLLLSLPAIRGRNTALIRARV